MVMNSFGKRQFCFFLRGGWGWVGGGGGQKDFLFFFSYSQTVPKYIPHNVPNGNTSVYPIWFAQSSAPMYINCKDRVQGGAPLFLSCNWGSKRGAASIGHCPMFQRDLLMGQSI
jgi:hypothetical protein